MKKVRNDQYEYIQQVNRLWDDVAARIGDEFERRYHLPDIVQIDEEHDIRALVLAPHQDDEVLGCGGTIHRLVIGGAKVTVEYMTDGRFGNLDHTAAEMIAMREMEAREGLRVLGIKDALFNKTSDLCLDCTPAAIEKVKETIAERKVNVLFVPHPRENHPDHWTTAKIASEALKGANGQMTIFQYEVWTPFVPNALIDITDCIDIKVRALREHQSQMRMIDYVEKICGLNAYRSINASSEMRYCEAFIVSNSKDFNRNVVESGLG
ncbi:MAG: PIG-L family deacetylase [Methanomassiliicoccales archaeon]|nr:PIG-L family deacetylase [Methanomassiliicoccales archaeon]